MQIIKCLKTSFFNLASLQHYPMKFSEPTRTEVMVHLEGYAAEVFQEFLPPVEACWQPADLLPDSTKESFFEEVAALRERAKELDYDLIAVLVGDTITEEALPTYESWLACVQGMHGHYENNWNKWVRAWTAEENRHGDLLNKYLYLSGRVNMKQMEASTQYLIADGFDIQTGDDPYRNFVYTSFQELATNISHRRVASLAKAQGDAVLARICGIIAADEARHARAYMAFIKKFFEIDPSETMLAFEDMMRKKIVMPAHFLRELGINIGQTFGHFTDAAQRLGVYTAQDYAEILESLVKAWDIESMSGLNEKAERARDYLAKLPERFKKVADRIKIPELEYRFSWIAGY
jgi:acyl-[acyl-carrier-protein] desaturase